MKIEIISGSARKQSITLRAAIHLKKALEAKAPAHEIGLIDLRENTLPFIDHVISSVEKAPLELKPVVKRMFDADAFIIVSPEYNGSFSPALANWFDHFPKQLHKAIGIVTASNGAMGGMRAALQLQHFALGLFAIPSPQMLLIGQVDQKFDENGNLLSENYQNSIDNFLAEYLWLAEKLHP